jgi:RNA polymerase sigma-70 factor (ECF subfamily)
VNTALEKAWTDVASQLRGYIRTRVRDHAAAEDILQDVFVKAQTRAAQLESADRISGWLFLIARNAVIDHFRTSGKKARLTEELPHDLEVQSEEEIPALENPEALREAFRRLVFTLPEPYREALVLTEYEGLTQKQLADRLGISLSGAKSRVQRAREKLKDALLDCCALEFDRRGNVIGCEARNSDCNC